MRLLFLLLSITIMTSSCAQLPYHSIPDYPEDFSTGNVIARMIDGLGYRYYWATEGLIEKDLKYKPSPEGRDTEHTLEHIYGLSETIVNAAKNKPNIRPVDYEELSFEDFRKGTLKNLKKASDVLRGKSDEEVANLKVIFKRGEKQSEFPFWHMLNGPIADALWHTGQVVSYRRSAGNPINSKVNVFMGHTKH